MQIAEVFVFLRLIYMYVTAYSFDDYNWANIKQEAQLLLRKPIVLRSFIEVKVIPYYLSYM